jgi:hypothetical protein
MTILRRFHLGAGNASLDGSNSWLQADPACQGLLTLRWSVHSAGYVLVPSVAPMAASRHWAEAVDFFPPGGGTSWFGVPPQFVRPRDPREVEGTRKEAKKAYARAREEMAAKKREKVRRWAR